MAILVFYTLAMKNGVIPFLFLGGFLLSAAAANAVAIASPYDIIMERNVFALKAPPDKSQPVEVKQPQPTVFLTGITTILGSKRALLKTTPTAVKAGETPMAQTYMLTEGQREGEVEVLQIDELQGKVKIRFAGKESSLDFENNGVKIVATPVANNPGNAIQPALPGFRTATAPLPLVTR